MSLLDLAARAGLFTPHSPGSRESAAVARGTLELTLDGDCRHGFESPGRVPGVYFTGRDAGAAPARHPGHAPGPSRAGDPA